MLIAWVSTLPVQLAYAAVIAAVSAAVFVHERGTQTSRIFLGFGATLSGLCLLRAALALPTDPELAETLFRYYYMLAAMASALFFHFCLLALQLARRYWALVHASWMLYVALGMLALESDWMVVGAAPQAWGWEARVARGALALLGLQMLQLTAVMLACAFQRHRQPQGSSDRRRLNAFCLLLFLLIFAVSDFVFHVTGLGAPLTTLALVPVMLCAGWIAWRHGLEVHDPALVTATLATRLGRAVLSLNAEGGIRDANDVAQRMIGQPRAVLVGSNLRNWSAEPVTADRLAQWAALPEGQNSIAWSLSESVAGAVPRMQELSAQITAERDSRGRLRGYLCCLTVETATATDAEHPELWRPEQLDRALRLAMRWSQGASGRSYAVLLISVDRFRRFNDSFGAEAGDELLRQLTRRLTAAVLRTGGGVLRVGGDEFAALVPMATGADDAQQIAHQMQAWAAAPRQVKGQEVYVSVTQALIAAGHYRDAEQMQMDFGPLMAVARDQARGGIYRVEAATGQVSAGRTSSQELLTAIGNGQLRLHFSPRSAAREARLVGLQTAVRWQHPQRGLLRLDQFAPPEADVDAHLALARWALSELQGALQILGTQLLPADFRVCVPWRGTEGTSEALREWLAMLSPNHRRSLKWLQIEVPEHQALAAHTQGSIRDWTEQHMSVCLRDFGAGLSSLSQLHAMRIHSVMLDAGFTQKVLRVPRARQVLAGIARMSDELRLNLVADGVSQRAEAEALVDIGCQALQGRLLPPARELGEALEWLRQPPALPWTVRNSAAAPPGPARPLSAQR